MRHDTITSTPEERLRQHQSHPRDWRENLYVYPVISRRSGGLSIGINLNPDAACNFDCIYCQVNRARERRIREVELPRLRTELEGMLAEVQSGTLWSDPGFRDVPANRRRLADIAFSGDGEPTTCPHFCESVKLVAELKARAGLSEAKIVLITNAGYLTGPGVAAGLAIMDDNNGEIWAKLDAGTEAYYQKVNRPNFPLQHVVDNITAAARARPMVIQSLFLRLDGAGPADAEVTAFIGRLHEITRNGGKLAYVQVYTVARRPAESAVTALTDAEVDRIANLVRAGGFRAEAFYAPQP